MTKTLRTWTDGAIAHELRKMVDEAGDTEFPLQVSLQVFSATEWHVRSGYYAEAAGHWGSTFILAPRPAQIALVTAAADLIAQVDESIALEAAMVHLMAADPALEERA